MASSNEDNTSSSKSFDEVDIKPTRQRSSAIKDIYEQPDDDGYQKDNGDDDLVKLKRRLTLLDGVAINIGIIIGSGIFVSPKGVLNGVGSVGATMVVWAVCGVFSMIGALCYAELGTMIPASGGAYAYIQLIYGDFFGFMLLWIAAVMAQPGSMAVVVLTFANYSLQPLYPDVECPPPRTPTVLIAITCTILVTLINAVSVRWSSWIQDVTSFCKVGALVIIIISGMVELGRGMFCYPLKLLRTVSKKCKEITTI
ncbi:putative L-type amino acid transporter 1-like protein MLAS [Lytechinus variegatus]|uniref:putative L-type amino acid transporter 1-like protein MLAS n=1 Tax=Lytechinus variegatus TaxID=7654 RepID=UPI001BB248E5|nr:putative L-type amino acid transporter 1-like protein MLAS [Lytechinus variegatus]